VTAGEARLAGGVAVITGAGSGIGAGLARRAGALGMTVIVTDINLPAAEAVAQQIRSAGGTAEAMQVDVSRHAELDRLAEDVFTRQGPVRLLVNNAGIETLGYCWEIPAERWESTLNINLHGVIHGTRAFVPRMLASGHECWIANLASIGAFGIMPTQSAYMVTKHAVQSFTENLFLELQLVGAPIHVSSVVPGYVKSAIFAANAKGDEPADAARHRQTMDAMMQAYGMDADEAAQVIMQGVAAGQFWVSTQPEVTAQMIAGRVAFLQEQSDPPLSEETRGLLRVS
jgi:NAD(P)-dependent dehydrogenase (short-subunit alcohol dehydrogenase family)